MPRFISADDGTWINVSHVTVVRERHFVGKKPFLIFESADGRSLGRLTDPDQDIEALAATVWPAAPGMTAIVIYTGCEADDWGDGRPDNAFSQHIPLVGWQLIHGAATPVLVESGMKGAHVLIALPDGKLIAPGDITYDNQAEAEARILKLAQADWDYQKTKADAAKRGKP
jgi:hypothetical protein